MTGTRVGLLAGAAALTLTGVGHARPAVEGTTQDEARIAALEAKIAALEAAQNQNWLTEQRANEVRSLVQDVLADADTRASLLQGGMTSGYDNGFVLGSSDGNWLLRTNFLMQQRFIWNNQDDTSDDSDRWGFENTRSKFILSGHVVNPDWFYRVDINVGSNDGGSFLIDDSAADSRVGTLNAYLGHDYGNGWKVMMGSMKVPFLHEEMVEAQHQLAVERSLVNYLFTGGYSDGVQVTYEGDQFRFMGMYSDGIRRGQMPWSDVDTEYAFTARGEFLASGNWDQFKDYTSMRDGETGVMIGGAVHAEKGEYGEDTIFTAASPEYELFGLTVDASAEFGGFNLAGAFVWMSLDNDDGVDAEPWGLMVQGGWYLNETWELFGRFELADFDADAPGVDVEDLTVLTVGVNKYFAGHNAKWTTDVSFGLDEIETVGLAPGVDINPAGITGFRSDPADEDGQLVFRTQWQILF